MSDMRYARVCETARRTEMNGYKVTWSQGYRVTTGTGAQPRPLAELENRFQIPNCKEMTQNSRNSSLLQSRRGRGCAPTEVTTWPGNHATDATNDQQQWISDGGLQQYRSAPVLGRSEHRLFRCVRFQWASLAFRHCCARGRAHSAETIPPPSLTQYWKPIFMVELSL